MDFLGVGPMEVLVILLIGFIIFGPQKLPDIGKGLGKAVREFKKQSSALTKDFQEAYQEGLDATSETNNKSPSPTVELSSEGKAAPGNSEADLHLPPKK